MIIFLHIYQIATIINQVNKQNIKSRNHLSGLNS